MTDWIKVQGAKPLEVDKDSSQTYVYIRKNITEIVVNSEMEVGTPTTLYEYEEKKMTKDEYSIYINEIEQLKLLTANLAQVQHDQDVLMLDNNFQLFCIKENIVELT